MKFSNKRFVGLFTAGAIIIAMSVPAEAATSGVSAGISEKIVEKMDSSNDVNAGISSALADCIDVSAAKATISSDKNAVTSSGQKNAAISAGEEDRISCVIFQK